MRGGKSWGELAVLIPCRTKGQCKSRWRRVLDSSIDQSNRIRITGTWTTDEDAKLMEAGKKHGKHWVAAATVVPGRTDKQCHNIWVNALDPANGKKGEWKPEEDANLADAVEKHGKHWDAILRSFRVERENNVGTYGMMS